MDLPADVDADNTAGHLSVVAGDPIHNNNINSDGDDDGDDSSVAEPNAGMEFDSEDAAKSFYDEYARRLGFSTKIGQHERASDPEGRIVSREFVCAREGLKRHRCEASLTIGVTGGNDKWAVTKFVKQHTHPIKSPSKVHYLRPRRHFAGPAKTPVEPVGIVPSGAMHASVNNNRVSAPTQPTNTNAPPIQFNLLDQISRSAAYAGRPDIRKKTLGKDSQNLLDYFKKMQGENPGFFYAIQLDQENRMGNVFWADARSRTAYTHFGDAVTLDTMCRVNKYKVPFAPFTGVNHHGQTVLFGCALLLDFSEASFRWLFKTFLAAMNDRAPVSLVTDKHRPIEIAIARVLPKTRHCINKWLILREGREKVAHVCASHPNFQIDLYNCINLSDTIEEFEFCWNSLIDKYDLARNSWLESLYSVRTKWVPAYFRDSFFAAVSLNQGFEGSLFDGYVNQQTDLPQFFRMYEKALENLFEKEIEAEFDTISTTPVLRTPSPMEKQAAALYTKRIFAKFQEELVETFVYTANRIDGDESVSTFRVAKFEDDHRAYIVTLNISEMKARCSCQMFEYSGILCRHVLTVFTVTNVLTLPSQYILKRWTRNAKTRAGSDENGSDLQGRESVSLRYNDICREAIKYAEEGAVTLETYNVAVSYLREGGKKISTVKKNVATVAPPPSHTSGSGTGNKATTSDATPLLWPRQDEVTARFNLNDSSVPAQPVSNLNLPYMAPVSLHRDDGTAENMVILPCLKSMTWVMESRSSGPEKKVAVINLKLQDYSKTPSAESEMKFQLSKITLEPMLRSMIYISEQLSAPANKVAVINLKLHDSETTSGESDVRFQVSRDTLSAMLRSMAYIREQLSNQGEPESLQPPKKKQCNQQMEKNH